MPLVRYWGHPLFYMHRCAYDIYNYKYKYNLTYKYQYKYIRKCPC